MKIRAFLYDLARNQSANPVNLRRIVRYLADFGYNMLVINLEYRFDFSSCPCTAPPGSLTAEMTRELVAYGRKLGVEVVPQLNILGHCEGITATERYARLSCDPYQSGVGTAAEQLNLKLPEARELIRRMVTDVCKAFPGRYLHAGLDEVRRTAALFPDAPDRTEETMIKHFCYALNLVRRTKRRILIWGDMPLKHEKLLPLIPKDVIICDWYYGPDGRRSSLEKYKKEGFRVLACPGVNSFWTYNLHPQISHDNITRMLTDARRLHLEGFLLTTWQYGQGRGMGSLWPWVALAGRMAAGEKIKNPEEFISRFATDFYGVDGRKFSRLYYLLSGALEKLFGIETFDEGRKNKSLATLRTTIFRGFFAGVFSPQELPFQQMSRVWEPSPFVSWIYLRRLLGDKKKVKQLKTIAEESLSIAVALMAEAKRNKSQLRDLMHSAQALAVTATRVRLLSRAKESYHKAALFQGQNPEKFRKHLNKTAELLEKLNPGLKTLKNIIKTNGRIYGVDAKELDWLRFQEKSLNEHIKALRHMKYEDDSLLEFGEFLTRPASINQRVAAR